MADIVVDNNQKETNNSTQTEQKTADTTTQISNQNENSEEAKKAEEVKKDCEESVQQVNSQVSAEKRRILKQQVDDYILSFGEIPSSLIKSICDSFKTLMTIASGYTDPSKYDFDPNKVIDSIIAMLDPIVKSLEALPFPSIPFLAELKPLLNKLKEFASNNQQDFPKKPDEDGILPEIPQEVKDVIKDILIVIQSICTTLPMVFIDIIFQMLLAIIDMFGQIAGVIGVPGIPFPLSLAPQCKELAPKIYDLVKNLPIRLSSVIENLIKKKIETISLSMPDMPESITIPKPLPPCPECDKVDLPTVTESTENSQSTNLSSTNS